MRDVDVYERVGEGTYGSVVFIARDRVSNETVALKRINPEQEENGFPFPALREVKILKALHHPNIVKLKEIVTSREQGAYCFVHLFVMFDFPSADSFFSRSSSIPHEMTRSSTRRNHC
jgi:cyclin-dependent kinase 2